MVGPFFRLLCINVYPHWFYIYHFFYPLLLVVACCFHYVYCNCGYAPPIRCKDFAIPLRFLFRWYYILITSVGLVATSCIP